MIGSFLEPPRSSHGNASPRPSMKKPRKSIGASPITGMMKDRYKQLLSEFEQIDKNKDNELTFDEVYEFLSKKQGSSFDKAVCVGIFKKLDKDQDNVVTVDEFLWSFVEAEDALQAQIKDIKKSLFDNAKKMDEFKKKLIQARTSETYNRHGIMIGSALTIEVLEAKGLIPMDSNGLSDPYVILECEGQKEQTKFIPETLTPVWNEEFIFNIETGTGDLKIVVMDRDFMATDDFEGQVSIPLSILKDQMKHDQYFPLLGPDNAIGEFGKIRLVLQWIWSKAKYLEDIIKQWEGVIQEDKKELNDLEEQLNKLKKPFGYLDKNIDWTIREERSVSTKGPGFEPGNIISNFDVVAEHRVFKYFDSAPIRVGVVFLYILLSTLAMFSRTDFFNVTVAISAASGILKKYSGEKTKNLAYLVGCTQGYDFLWFCIYSGKWNSGEEFHFWALLASYLNFIIKFGVFLALWRIDD